VPDVHSDLANLKDANATVEDAIDAVVPILTEAGAV
jgi:hypothetical protein